MGLTAWRAMEEASFFKRLGQKVCMARFLAIIGSGRDLLSRWHSYLFEVTVTALEHDFVTTKIAPKVKLRAAAPGAPTDAETTSRKHITEADRSLRSCGANAVAISLAVLSDSSNLRVLVTVVKVCEPLMSWMGRASARCREVAESKAWLFDQVRGDSMKVVADTLAVLLQENYLRAALFLTSTSEALVHLGKDEVMYEDECAAMVGDFALALAKARARRSLQTTVGIPHRFVLFVGTSNEQLSLLAEVKRDAEIFSELQSTSAPSSLMRSYISRSPFQMLSVKQFVLACEEFKWVPDQ